MNPPAPETRRRFPWKLLIIALISAIVMLAVVAAMSGMFDRYDHNPNQRHTSTIVPKLMRQWNSTKLSSRKGAMGYIAKLSGEDPAIYAAMESVIEAATQDIDEQVRTLALKALADHRSPKLVPLARAQLADSDPAVRLIGLRALATADSLRAAASVRQLIDDPNAAVRASALRIITRANRAQVDPALLRDFPVDWQPTSWEAQALARYTTAAKQWVGTYQPAEEVIVLSKPSQIPLPETELINLAGERTSFTTFKGKPLLVNFWDFAETNSVEMLGALSALQSELIDKIQIVAIFTDQRDNALTNKCDHSALDETGNHACKNRPPTFNLVNAAERIRREMENRHVTLPMFVDLSGRASLRFATDTLPSSTLINSDGIIARRFVGTRPLDSLRAMIAESICKSPKP